MSTNSINTVTASTITTVVSPVYLQAGASGKFRMQSENEDGDLSCGTNYSYYIQWSFIPTVIKQKEYCAEAYL